jgi:catechol 2,3-dioxygenase-like lactoylglutathione lyase family enzyme
MRIHATCLDHVVLNVSDLDASRRWSSTLIGA